MYLFYLGGMLLPVTPSKITTKIGNSNKTMELANEGEINLIKFPKLTEYSFEFELPFSKLSYSARECDPKEILDMLEEAKLKKKILTFQVARKMHNKTRFALEQQVSVEEYEVLEDAENNSDITVSITLRQFRKYRTQHLLRKEDSKRPASKKDNKKTSQKTTACLKKIELLSDMNLRSGAGTQNRKLAIMRKGEQPVVYGEFNYNGTTWYKIKHSAGDKDKNGTGWAWVSGKQQYAKVLKDFNKITATAEAKIGQKGHYRK